MVRPRKDQQIDITSDAISATLVMLECTDTQSITLAKVADAIGCRAPALYNYFSSKEGLLDAVREAGFNLLLQEKRQTASHYPDSPVTRLEEGGKAYLRFAFQRPGLYRLMFSAETPFSTRAGSTCLNELKNRIEECQAAGYLRTFPADEIAFILWSSIHGVAWMVLNKHAPHPDQGEAKTLAFRSVETLITLMDNTR